MELPILFEDEAMIAVDKPAGLVVNRALSVKGETVQDWSDAYLGLPKLSPLDAGDKPSPVSGGAEFVDPEVEFINRSGIVHRIDKETSGILLIAKTPATFGQLQREFKERLVKKTYLAIVHGAVVPSSGTVEAPVGRLPWNREHFGVLPSGKAAITRYQTLETRSFERAGRTEQLSLLALYPETGRTHQIRVHLQYLNHPIVGDHLYAGRKRGRDDRQWVGRVMLHAWKISLPHPATGTPLAITSPVPDDMSRVMKPAP